MKDGYAVIGGHVLSELGEFEFGEIGRLFTVDAVAAIPGRQVCQLHNGLIHEADGPGRKKKVKEKSRAPPPFVSCC